MTRKLSYFPYKTYVVIYHQTSYSYSIKLSLRCFFNMNLLLVPKKRNNCQGCVNNFRTNCVTCTIYTDVYQGRVNF